MWRNRVAVEAALEYANLLIAVAVLLGGAISLWRGTLHELVVNIRRIEHIEDKQEDMADGVVAISHAVDSESVQIEPRKLEQDLRDDEKGPGRYVKDNKLYRGAEDEEESRVRMRDGGLPEVDEPE